jgi:hypothetical protein
MRKRAAIELSARRDQKTNTGVLRCAQDDDVKQNNRWHDQARRRGKNRLRGKTSVAAVPNGHVMATVFSGGDDYSTGSLAL